MLLLHLVDGAGLAELGVQDVAAAYNTVRDELGGLWRAIWRTSPKSWRSTKPTRIDDDERSLQLEYTGRGRWLQRQRHKAVVGCDGGRGR